MNSLFGSQKATMKLKLKALPVFDKRKRRDLPERDGSGRCDGTTGKNANGDANVASLFKPGHYAITLTSNLLTSCAKMAARGEAMAKKLAKGIEVKPGEIVIPFTD